MKKNKKKLTSFIYLVAIFLCISANSQTTWIGNNTAWFDSGNWVGGPVPGSFPVGLTINIPVVGSGFYPVIPATITMDNTSITVADGASLTIVSGGLVLSNPGSSLTMNSNSVLTNNGTIANVNGGTVTFKSGASGSAYIGNSVGSFTGDVVVERYIDSQRAFRFLSTPVTTSSTIRVNWQNGGVDVAGVGTDITGTGGGANGFDATATNNSSMFTYDNSTQAWNAIGNTTGTVLTAGVPYRIMIRGDRTTDLTNNAAAPSATTLSSTGALAAENSAPSALDLNDTANAWNLVGNPYQAPIDMDDVVTANLVTSSYTVWDRNLNTRGGYVTVTLPGGGSITDANQYLQPGQAAFVQTDSDGGTATLQFTQASKNTSNTETAVFKSSGKKQTSTSKLSLKLYESTALAENKSIADGILIFFDASNTNDKDSEDASKLTNLDENFATSNGGNLLSIEKRAIPVDSEEIPLDITTYRNTNYTIVAEGSSLLGASAYLFDAHTNESTEIPKNGVVNYAYTVDANVAASVASDRFKVNFASKNLSVSELAIAQIQIYPNPVNDGNVYLKIPQNMDDLEVVVYSALGVQLFSKNGFAAGSKAAINTDFAKKKGVYFVRLTSKGNSITKKLYIN